MILRKLKTAEHGITRPLWEQVFDEDPARFLDYYYTEKTTDNEIYVIEADGAVRAMLHLNPYQLCVGTKEMLSSYIVGVATEEAYRRQGYMANLLHKSLRDMYAQGLPFTFLMPASEQIYYPHGFRFIYAANQWKAARVDGKPLAAQDLLTGAWKPAGVSGPDQKRVILRPARMEDAKRLAQFAGRLLREHCQVYVKRDWSYYERLLKEQESADGGILLAEVDGQIQGILLFDDENGFSMREPLTLVGREQIFAEAGLAITRAEKKRPLIMARLLCVEKLLSGMVCREEMNVSLLLEDPILRENHRLLIMRGNPDHLVVRSKPYTRGMEKEYQRISVAALTSLLFGYRSLEQIEEEEQESFSEEFKEQARRLVPLSEVLLNEAV